MTLDELDALHAAATAGPWEVLVTPESQFCEWRVVGPHYDDAFSDAGQSPCDDDTRDAIVALHNAWPAISARLRAAAAEVEQLQRHYDAAAPEHNLLAVLDLYEGRRLEAEAEVERLRGALRGAIEELDTIPEDPKRFARVAGMTIPLVRGGLAKALLPAEARAALGEP